MCGSPRSGGRHRVRGLRTQHRACRLRGGYLRPGATNAVTGLLDAPLDSVPFVCLSGQAPLHLIGDDTFQEADINVIMRSVTKHNYLMKIHGHVGQGQELLHGGRYSEGLSEALPDFLKLVDAFGAAGMPAPSLGDLDATIRAMLACDRGRRRHIRPHPPRTATR